MTARTVTGTVEFPVGSGTPCVGARVVAELYTGTDGTTVYGTTNDVAVGSTAVLTDLTGAWTLALEPNSAVTPAGTVWHVAITRPGGTIVVDDYIEVPDSVGPHDFTDILTDAPGALPSQALAAHMADTSAHGVNGAVVGTTDTQTLTNKTISGGTISGITDLAVADGGTGASGAADARNNLDTERKRTFDVRDYGATADGVTDDTSAFDDAFTAAVAALGVVSVPAGTYLVSSLTPSDDVRIVGAGRDLTILTLVSSATGAVIGGTGCSNVSITDLTVNGNLAGQVTVGGRDGIRFISSTDITVERVRATNCKEDGFHFSACDSVNLSDLDADDNGRNGYSCGDSVGATTNLLAVNLRSSGHDSSGGIGFSLEPAKRARVTNFYSNGDFNGVVIGGGASDTADSNTVAATIIGATNVGVVIIPGTAGARYNRVTATGPVTWQNNTTAASDNQVTSTVTDLSAGAPAIVVHSTTPYWSYPSVHSTNVTVAGVLYLHPAFVPKNMTVDRIGAEVTVGAVGSTLTMLVYEETSAGVPGALVYDSAVHSTATVDGNSATAQEITCDVDLVGGRIYWFGCLVLGGTPTVRVMSSSGTTWRGDQVSLANALGTGAQRPGRNRTGLAAVPNPAGTTGPAGSVPLVALRIA